MRQVRPKTEGWQQKKDADGKPLLQFASPKRGKPPVHLADLTPDERVAKVKELGLPGFRAKQLEKHYFTHWTHDPAAMSDLPAEGREEFVHGMLPPLLTEVRRLETDRGDTIKFLWKLHDGALVESVLDALPGPHHAVRLVAGGLRHELPVLRDRPGGPHPQHVGRRDHRADRARQPADRRWRAGRQEAATTTPQSA